MTITSTDHQRFAVNGLIHLAARYNIQPSLVDGATIEARYKPVTDDELRRLLTGFNDIFTFDPAEATLTCRFSSSVNVVIDVSQIGLADVLAITDDTRPPF